MINLLRISILAALIGAAVLAGAAAAPAAGEEAGPRLDGNAAAESRQSRQSSVSIGVTVDYAWWDPIWGRMSQAGDMFGYMLINQAGPYLKIERASRAYSVGPAPLYGVRLEADLPEGWGLSAGAIVGPYRDASVMVASLTTRPFVPSEYVKYRIDTFNFDSHVLVQYRPCRWFRLSFGPAYQGYVLREQNSSYLNSEDRKESMHMAGFKAGGIFTVRLVENLFFKPDLSFLALYGFTAGKSAFARREHPVAIGAAAIVPLSYYAEKIHVTFSVGFKYQFLHYLRVSNADYLNRHDHRYGVTESITYTF